MNADQKSGDIPLPTYQDQQTQDKQYEPMIFAGHHISDILQENDQLKQKVMHTWETVTLTIIISIMATLQISQKFYLYSYVDDKTMNIFVTIKCEAPGKVLLLNCGLS